MIKLMVVLIFSLSVLSQYRENYIYTTNWSVGAGLSTHSFLFNDQIQDNMRIYQEDQLVGGGLDATQLGLDLRFTYFMDEGKYRIPFGINYMLYRSSERIDVRPLVINNKNSADLLSFYYGFHFRLKRLYLANGDIYAGVELRSSYVTDYLFEYNFIVSNDQDFNVTRTDDRHNGKFRQGVGFRLGYDAELQKRIMVNFSMGYEIYNLIGRDDSVGSLFVPDSQKFNENLLQVLSFSLIIQYRK